MREDGGPAPGGATLDLPALARELRAAIERATTVLVASEPSPDGDAFGSELALVHAISAAFGLARTPDEARPGRGPKWVAVLNEHGSPGRYRFLDGADRARVPTAADRAAPFDLGILVDGGVERCGPDVGAIFAQARAKAYVDHHRHGSRERYDLAIVDATRASTTELIFGLLDTDAWRDVPLARPLAEALYVGLLSDTGSFVFSLTTPHTHRVAARLLEAGVRHTLIGERILYEIELADLVLKGHVIQTMTVEHDGATIVGVMPLELLHGRDPQTVGYDKVVGAIGFVTGVKVTVLLRQLEPEGWKVSLRSRGAVDVAALACDLDPHGGGHARAAGCFLRGPLTEVRARCLEAIGRFLHPKRA